MSSRAGARRPDGCDRAGRHRDAADPRGARASRSSELRAYASPRSEGRKLPFAGGEVTCEVLARRLLRRSRPRDRRRRRPARRGVGAASPRPPARKVVDNSAAFRMDPDVPLVVAEVNPDDLRDMPEGHRVVPELHDDDPGHRARAAAPRRADRPHGRVDVPVGVGRGQAGMHELDAAVDEARRPRPSELRARGRARRPLVEGEVWPKPIAGNVIPLAGSVKEAGYTSEEWKMVRETRKILHDDEIHVHRHVRAGAGVRRPRDVAPTSGSTAR